MRTTCSLVLVASLVGCGGDDASNPSGGDGGSLDAGITDSAAVDARDAAPLPKNIQHVVVIVQENHTFDAYFGRYCTAKAGSDPTCTQGPSCCEAAPDKEPSGSAPVTLDDASNSSFDRKHTTACEADAMNGGKMDRYVTSTVCGDARNYAIAPNDVVATYHAWANQYALADRYFQPLVGSSSANDMYFAVAKYVFTDNDWKPDTDGAGCTLPATRTKLSGQTTLADLVIDSGHSFAHYAEGYAAMLKSTLCPAPPSDCPAHIPTSPCDYDPSDNPFQYYAQFADNPKYMKDFSDLGKDIAAGTLPNLAFVKPLQYHDEHPGYGTKISMGVAFVDGVVQQILASKYASDTLILVTWDEGGGFFDHVTPPLDSNVDGKPYGTRVPMLALGKFARSGYVSHVPMEHSSIVRFIEWNFTDKTGQLGARDAVVRSIGDLIDPEKTRVPAD